MSRPAGEPEPLTLRVRGAVTRPRVSLRAMRQRGRTPRRRPEAGRIDALALNALAVGWIARGMWRMRQGRLPWQTAPPRRRAR